MLAEMEPEEEAQNDQSLLSVIIFENAASNTAVINASNIIDLISNPQVASYHAVYKKLTNPQTSPTTTAIDL